MERIEKYAKLKGRMTELGVTQEILAKVIDRSLSATNAKLNGQREFTVGESIAICEYLKIDDPRTYFYA